MVLSIQKSIKTVLVINIKSFKVYSVIQSSFLMLKPRLLEGLWYMVHLHTSGWA